MTGSLTHGRPTGSRERMRQDEIIVPAARLQVRTRGSATTASSESTLLLFFLFVPNTLSLTLLVASSVFAPEESLKLVIKR